MKKFKLQLDDFLNEKLVNQIEIKGGDEGEEPLPTGGGSNDGGNGNGGVDPTTPFPPLGTRLPAAGSELDTP